MPASEGLTKQLFALVSKHKELLIGVLSMEDEAEDETAVKKIPLLLIQGITQFTLQIPCNDACRKVSCSEVCPRCRFHLLLNNFGCTWKLNNRIYRIIQKKLNRTSPVRVPKIAILKYKQKGRISLVILLLW